MEGIVGTALIVWFVATTGITIEFLAEDYRIFRNIEQQCEKQGFIQNKTTRIMCKKEKQ